MTQSSETAVQSASGGAIDTNLYSRQIGAFGMETMGKLIKMRCLLCGLNGVGAETAKNLILAGPSVVSLHDDTCARIQDLGANFYIRESDVTCGRTRAEACAQRLAELNNNVRVDIIRGPITEEILGNYDILVVTGSSRLDMIRLNNLCRLRNPPIGFIATDCFGLASCCFVDFGESFTVFDATGEPLRSAIVEAIIQGNPGLVHLHTDRRNPFQEGDFVSFREVRGMTEINCCEPMEVVKSMKSTIEIGDTSGFSPHTGEGIVTQVKVPVKFQFQSLERCILCPVPPEASNLIETDFAKCGRASQLHYAVQSVYRYRDVHGQLPRPRSSVAVNECMKYATELNEEARRLHESLQAAASQATTDSNDPQSGTWKPVPVDAIDRETLEKVVLFAACEVSPMCSFIGGIVAQEVVKFTGKFTPIRQWLYFDALEALCKEDAHDTERQDCRYDDQITIWGQDFVRRLADLRIFLVGAGALGCEYLKSFALMGCSRGTDGGCITMTDMDRVEISNLNRQFLFRAQHVGKSKSQTAAESALVINPGLNIEAREIRVGPESEEQAQFGDAFWEGLDIVVNALDNVPSRNYVDGRCVWHRKPLLDAGTLGTKGNVQVVLPWLTQCYSDSQDPPEESIPLCTLRHFPNQIEHTIEWARDLFQGEFCGAPQEAEAFLHDPVVFLERLRAEGTPVSRLERLTKICDVLEALDAAGDGTGGIESCVARAIRLFTSYFDHQIAQLLHNFPLDHITSSGQPFWSGPKRAPQVISFNATDELHLDFIFAAANLIAFNLDIPQNRSRDVIRDIASLITPPVKFAPKMFSYKLNDRDTTVEGTGDEDMSCQRLENQLQASASRLLAERNGRISIFPVDFDKDDDSNFHIAFIAAAANLRASNYRIPQCDQFTAKMIAGRIIPAIATTTAAITGLASLELLKIVTREGRPLENFKNSFINLGTVHFVLTEPPPPIRTLDKQYDAIVGGPVRARPSGFTSWDLLEVTIPNATLEQLISQLEKTQEVEVSILSVGNVCLYNSFIKSHQQRRAERVKDLTERISKTLLPRGRKYIAVEASCSDKDGVEVLLPTIKLVFAE